MRVLAVIHGVLAGLRKRQLQIDIAVGVWLAQIEEKPRGVDGHLFKQRHQRDRLAGALGELQRLAVLHQVHHLHQHHLQPFRVNAQRLQRGLQARHVTVMVRAQHVHGKVEITDAQLIVMVCDIRHDIRIEAVGPAQNEILVAAELLRFEPQRAVLLVGVAVFGQLFHHGLCRAGGVQRALAEPRIVNDVIFLQVALQPLHVQRQGIIHQRLAALGLGRMQILIAVDIGERSGVVDDVLPVVAVLRHLNGVAEVLTVTDIEAQTELFDLVAAVVDIEFPFGAVARPCEHLGKSIADGAAAGVADVHRARGVGGNEFHQRAPARKQVGTAVILPRRRHVQQDVRVIRLPETEIDKPWPRRLAGGKIRALKA